jgi:molybdopterin-guanine dinucleotide biosynthesis protein A
VGRIVAIPIRDATGVSAPVVGVILAGGLARRMGGGDKALLPLAGRTLLDHLLARLQPQVAAVVLNANGDPARFASWQFPVVPDTLEDHLGPLAGILAGMRWAASHRRDTVDIVTVPADTPFVPRDLVARLLQGRDAMLGARCAVAQSQRRIHPTVGLWPVSSADDLDAALRAGLRKVADWLPPQQTAAANFSSPDGDPFFNVNTPDDLALAERMAALMP